MKKVLYMVKKNPAMDNQENWMMLGRKEFMKNLTQMRLMQIVSLCGNRNQR